MPTRTQQLGFLLLAAVLAGLALVRLFTAP
jgi:hypothetical protein